MEGSAASCQSELLVGIVEDDSEGEPLSGMDRADAMTHGYTIDAASAALGAMIDGEDNGFALCELDDGDSRLHAGTLFGEDELSAGEVARGFAEQEGYLERKDKIAVEVLVEAVVVARAVLQEQRCGAGLAGFVAELLKA
jgi:hypothetical protein